MTQVAVTGTASFPASDLQQAYLLGELGGYALGGPALFYEEYACPALDVAGFTAAVDTLVIRHPMLRARFDPDGTVAIQPDVPSPVSCVDLRGRSVDECDVVLAESRRRAFASGPPLSGSAAIALSIFRLDTGYRVQLCGRLLAFDGQSGEVFAEELKALLAGQELAPLDFTYERYRRELHDRRAGEVYARARQYWLDRLDALPPAPELPHRRGTVDADAPFTRRTYALPPDLTTRFFGRVRAARLTPTMAVSAAFCEVLRHWSKSTTFTINVMYGERQNLHPDVARLIGNFSSTLLLEYAPTPEDTTFGQRANRLRRRLLQDFQHGSFGGVEVIRELNRRTGNVAAAMMPVVFTSMLGVGEDTTGVFLEHLGYERLDGRVRTPQVSFDHQVFMSGNQLTVTWDTVDALYPDGLVDAMFAAYTGLLERLAAEDDAWQGELGLTPDAQLRVRTRVNDTYTEVPPTTLHGMFLAQAERAPDRPAVLTREGTVSYGELRDRASAVAAFLRARGVAPGDLVGVLIPRGAEQIAALLGVLCAGAAYVPVSVDWPEARRARVLETAQVRLLLTGAEVRDAPPAGFAPSTVDSEALAYVIFTSGTTGRPKGVMIRHQSAANTIVDLNARFAVMESDRVLAVSDFTFDLSVYDVFGLLAAGGAVVVPDADQAREVVHLHELAIGHGVTIWNSVPAYLGMFVDFVAAAGRAALTALRVALVSGDWVPLTLARELARVAPNAGCVSLGGATEASIWSNYFPVPVRVPEHWVSIPYGYPLRNQGYRVLDTRLVDRPDWVPGELYITGRGLADGYLGDAELTARAFLDDPRTGQRLYRTGDWARYWPDGTLEFLGREDQQVKVNGFRVELSEIETCLLGHPAVADAVVVARQGPRGVSLVGFVSATGDPDALRDELRSRLSAALPGYMVPPVLEVAESLPLTTNGKVDRRALAEAANRTVGAERGGHRPPRTDTEKRLAALWTELLGVPAIGVGDEFFALGGNSLQAAQLMNRIEAAYGVRLPLATLYTEGSVGALAHRIDSTTGTGRYVVPLSTGEQPPVVFVHPVGGDVLCYRELVPRLRTRFRLFGVQQAGEPAGSLDELADRYLPEVLAAVPDGPVRLAGWSLGGLVAYELGRRVVARGRGCTVALIDPWLPAASPEPSTADLVRAFRHNLSGGTGGPVDATTLYDGWRADPTLAGLGWPEVEALYATFAANTAALRRYEPPDAPGLTVHVVEAEQALGGASEAYLQPLRRHPALPASLRGARWHRHAGDHFAVVDAARAATVAAAILAAFAAA